MPGLGGRLAMPFRIIWRQTGNIILACGALPDNMRVPPPSDRTKAGLESCPAVRGGPKLSAQEQAEIRRMVSATAT